MMTVAVFRRELGNLDFLLSGVVHPSYPHAAFDIKGRPGEFSEPRKAKVCSQVLPFNPYFKEYVRESRRLLGISVRSLKRYVKRGAVDISARH